jgi:hypothetical protein
MLILSDSASIHHPKVIQSKDVNVLSFNRNQMMINDSLGSELVNERKPIN